MLPHRYNWKMRSAQSEQIQSLVMSPAGATLFMAAGIVAVCISFYMFFVGMSQNKWPGTYAKVTDGAVCHYGRRPYFYRVRLGYKYSVEGTEYTGSCDLNPTNPTSAGDANELMAKYWPNGRALEVYYDPKHPSTSVQDKGGASGNGAGFLIFGLLFVLAGFGIKRVTSNK